jgi:flagellar hook-associated protein 3 FlgL
MTRVANLAQFDRTVSRINDTQQLWNKLQTQIASGRKSDDYAGLGRDAERLVSLQSTHGRLSQYTDNNKIAEARLQTMESSISQVFDILSHFKTLLVNALNSDNGASLALPTQTQNMLDQVSSLLNVRDGNRYLFAGSKTDTRPVDLASLPVAYVVPTTAGDSIGYYQGDAVALKVQADDSLQVTYGVTAGDPAIEAGIRALHLGVTQGPTDRVALNHALEVVNEALQTLPDVRTRIGAARTALENTNKTHSDYLHYVEQNVSDIENVDVTEAVSRMNNAQLSLNASYMMISKLSQMSLLNYLK